MKYRRGPYIDNDTWSDEKDLEYVPELKCWEGHVGNGTLRSAIVQIELEPIDYYDMIHTMPDEQLAWIIQRKLEEKREVILQMIAKATIASKPKEAKNG